MSRARPARDAPARGTRGGGFARGMGGDETGRAPFGGSETQAARGIEGGGGKNAEGEREGRRLQSLLERQQRLSLARRLDHDDIFRRQPKSC